jgi:DNA-binding MarR family transcriptional regulator
MGLEHNRQLVENVGMRAIEVGLRDECDLDLLLFFSRHPSVVLTSEQLAAYVGYDLQQVARSLDLLLGTGLLRRSLNQATSGRMYVLETGRSEEWLEPLQRVCATPDGRNALRAVLRRRRSPAERSNGGTSNQRALGGRHP